jgi:DNA polymerase-3 subunit delta'
VDKRDISVDAVRELSERLALTAHYGGNKVAIIEPADALNVSGVNALLKTIEEPPAGSYLLLLTDRPMLLAPTLRSRCQFIRFGVPPKEQALAWLRAQNPAADESALRAAHGAPVRALDLLAEGTLALHAQWRRALDGIASGQESPLTIAGSFEQGKTKMQATRLLEWLMGWAVSQQRGAAAGSAKLSEAAQRLGPAGLDQVAQGCVRALQQLQQNAPPQLAVESIIIRLWQLSRAPTREMRA